MLALAMHLPASDVDVFVDDDQSPFEADIQRLYAAGVTVGCTTDRFCPGQPVTRAEMASFLARALRLPITVPDDPFDGRMVLGLPSLAGYGGLAVMEGTRVPRTIIEDSVGDPRLSPDGNRIAYIDIRRECPPDAVGPGGCYSRLFSMAFEGGVETQVTSNDLRPVGHDWTPTGDEIAFFDWGGTDIRLSAVDPETGSVRRLSGPLDDDPSYLSWSTGDVLAVIQPQPLLEGTFEITLMTTEGATIGTIEEPKRDLLYPRWSPDGTRLAYWSQGDGTNELVTTDAGGGDRHVVISADDGWAVAWSPDGTKLAYLGGGQVWCVEAAGGEPWPLTPSGIPMVSVDWR